MGTLQRAVAPLLLVSMLLGSSLTQAREAQLPASGDRPAPALPASGARADTLFLFAASGPGSYGSPGTDARGFTFDHAGGPAPAGWFGVDLTINEAAWWQVASTAICAGTGTDMSQAVPFDTGDTVNDYALWCGRHEVCRWVHETGYGNDWRQLAVLDLAAHPVHEALVVDFAYRSDFEGGSYDFFELRAEAAGEWVTVYSNTIGGDRTYRELSIEIPAGTIGGAGATTRVAFYFRSDGAWSDEDGSYSSDVGALWIDNVRARVDGTEVFAADFEDGLVPAGLSFETPPGAGDYAALRAGLFQEDPEIQNDSYCWTFFDPALANEDYPDGIIPFGPPYVFNAVQSPWLSMDQYGRPFVLEPEDLILVHYWMYGDQPDGGLVFIAENPDIAARVASGCEGPFVRNSTTLWPDYIGEWCLTWSGPNLQVLASASAAGGGAVTGLALRLGVQDLCGVWCNVYGDGTPHTSAPYYDNIRVMVLRDLTPVEGAPAATMLLGAHPNPFNPKTTIRFSLAEASPARLEVFDLAGRRVATLLEGPAAAGEQSIDWDGRDDTGRRLASGVYLLRFAAAGVSEESKLVLLK